MKLYMFSDSSSVHHQEFIHCTFNNVMSYWFVLTALEQEHSPDNGQTNCPKYVVFYDKINLRN